MVKEFQQLRKQITQILLENHQQKKETIKLVAKEREEKEKVFVDLIKIIEQLARKEEVAIKVPKLASTTNQNLSDTYNNIKNALIKLLATHGVHAIIGREAVEESEGENREAINQRSAFPKKRFSYQGKILNE